MREKPVGGINRWLLLALALTFVYHGALLLRTFSGTYDGYIHMFFADHYARSWFDNWEPRWYTGFTITSYPPGSHQSIALLSHLIGLRAGFIVVQLAGLLFSVLGVYRFAQLWVSEEAAGYAALLAAFSTSIGETVHIYGQLPTIFSLGFLLNALPFAYRWLRRGGWGNLLSAWALNAACTAGHHVTTLFGAVFFLGPVIVAVLLEALLRPLPDEAEGPVWSSWRAGLLRYWRRVAAPFWRAAAYGVGLIAILIVVVLPYWYWSVTDPITQVSIPHPSRDSYFVNLSAGLLFWLVPYGVGILGLPYVFWRSLCSRAWPLGLSFSLLTLLGTAGTTPLPRLILGHSYDILTMDRFAFWSTIIMLPFLGEFVVSLLHGRIALWISMGFGSIGLRAVQGVLAVVYLLAALLVAGFVVFRPVQPEALDMRPIVDFLAKDQHSRYRYLTLGFGDQQAWLAAQTTAVSVDGDYHSARRLPELTTEPVGTLDGSKYMGEGGMSALRQVLGFPEKYNLKYTFNNDRFFDPLLYFSGWNRVERLENGVTVWERGDVPPLPATLPRRDLAPWLRLIWGIAPMTAIALAILAITAGLWGPPARRVARFLGIGWPQAWRQRRRSSGVAAAGDEPHRLHPAAHAPGTAGGVLGNGGPLGRVVRAWEAFVRRVPTPSARQAAVASLVCMALIAAVVGWRWQVKRTEAREPLAVVAAYYHELDFRLFEQAWKRLDPQARPSFEQYRLDRSLEGGLVASYGKLDSLQTQIVRAEPDRLEVRADLRWQTALGEYPTTENLVLVRRNAQWFVEPQTTATVLPPDEFMRQAAVIWRSQGRRQATIGTTDYEDILDRPDIQVLSARLVVVNGRYSVVGEVLNRDVDPADVTVTAIFYGRDGAILARYNAQFTAIHRLFPKEIAPFRVDFTAVAAAGLTADPSQIAAFTVQAQALVSGNELGRDAAVQGVRVVTGSDGRPHLVGQVFNGGTTEATIPHLLATYYDDAGRVVWVDDQVLAGAIRPQRAESFDLAVPPVGTLQPVEARGALAANGLPSAAGDPASWGERLPLPPGSGYASVRVTVDYFVGTKP